MIYELWLHRSNNQTRTVSNGVQRPKKWLVRGLVKFLPAVPWLFCLELGRPMLCIREAASNPVPGAAIPPTPFDFFPFFRSLVGRSRSVDRRSFNFPRFGRKFPTLKIAFHSPLPPSLPLRPVRQSIPFHQLPVKRTTNGPNLCMSPSRRKKCCCSDFIKKWLMWLNQAHHLHKSITFQL